MIASPAVSIYRAATLELPPHLRACQLGQAIRRIRFQKQALKGNLLPPSPSLRYHPLCSTLVRTSLLGWVSISQGSPLPRHCSEQHPTSQFIHTYLVILCTSSMLPHQTLDPRVSAYKAHAYPCPKTSTERVLLRWLSVGPSSSLPPITKTPATNHYFCTAAGTRGTVSRRTSPGNPLL